MGTAHYARLRGTRGLSFTVILTAAIGIGSTAVVYGFIRGLLTSHEARAAPVAIARVGFLLTTVAIAVLMMTCATVACFQIARASAQSKDTAVRVALGATRWQLVKELASEAALISVIGGAMGAMLAFWTSAVIPAFFYEPDADQLLFALDRRSVAATSAICITLTIVCGLVPIIDIRDDEPARVLQRESLGASPRTRRFRSAVVIVQLACCCALIISAGLLLDDFHKTLETRIGQQLGNAILVTVQAEGRSTRSEQATRGLEYFRQVQEALQSPSLSVSAAAWTARPPGSWPALQSFQIELPDPPLREVVADVATFTARSLDIVRVPPLDGRMFGGGDAPDRCPVVIVNEAAAQELFGGHAVGRFLDDPAGNRVHVIGVVAMRAGAPASADRPTVYYYADQTGPPLGKEGPTRFFIGDRPREPPAMLDANVVSTTYFTVLGLPLMSGAVFPMDRSSRACRVGVIDQTAADRHFGGHAIGGAVVDSTGQRTTIVGVVQSSLFRHWQRAPAPTIYFPDWQDAQRRMTLVIRGPEDDEKTVAAVSARTAGVPGSASEAKITTLDAHLSRTALAPERIATALVSAAAAIAFALGILGAHGIMAESARQRRREIALRIALGAQRWRVVRHLLREAFQLAAVGIVAGVACAFIAAPWLTTAGRALNHGLSLWLAGPVALIAIVTIATVIPARRALAVDVLAAMREP